ncbi:hypothetical protein [Pseudidiomarina sp. CB1]|uniref:hypothetical protein n=1 Tax=Pseudidiomarina sp. CB1 TaxID=2972484 RepID=UPI0021638CDA|nr:hypothetical protein [Pseudidiomarina sp. CB1]
MLLRKLGIVLCAALGLWSNSEAAEPCLTPGTDYLALEFMEFDQTMDAGWREVANREGCKVAAAELIKKYRTTHSELHDGQLSIMRWHEGQMRAEVGQNEQAVALFETTYKAKENDSFGWNYYVDATIAFLQQDREALLQAREQLAALPEPSGVNMTDADGNPVEMDWPPNLHVVDDFVACFGKSYAESYGGC